MIRLGDLNPEQRQAVEAEDGPLLIIAGPGTGKTKTLTARIVHLIESGHAKPSEMLALTFTNKAAREMQERVASELKPGQAKPTITTFHALAQKLLGTENSKLVSPAERTEIIQSLKKARGRQWSSRDIGLLVSNAKNRLGQPDDAAVKALVDAYNAELALRDRYDFDDLLLTLHQTLQQHKISSYQHILVDEFQDTNDVQYELLKLLDTTNNLFVIGDPLQAIYGFRGANERVFERFTTDRPGARVINLATNYRSSVSVVKLANAIFPDARQLQPHRTEIGAAVAIEVLNEYSEADWIVKEIEKRIGGSDMLKGSQYYHDNKQRCFGDFAILYRTHAVAKTMQKALDASGIPYQVAGEGSPYTQPFIQEFLQAMAYIAGMGDAPAVGKLTKTQVQRLLKTYNASAFTPGQLAAQIIGALGMPSERNQAMLQQFMSTLVRFEALTVQDYLIHVESLAEQEYYDPAADAVALLTIHASKGLEFPQVFLLGAEQGGLPLLRRDQEADVAEEKRLFYVAATRARDNLYILHTQKRAKEQRQSSEFLEILSKDVLMRTVDPEMPTQIRKIHRRQQKRAQGSLF